MDNENLVRAFFTALGGGEMESWAELIGDDVVVDTPFAVEGRPTHFEGKAEVLRRFGEPRAAMDRLEFFDLVLLHTVDNGPVVVTCRSEGRFRDGRRYQNRYCWLFQISDQKISAWTEYFDPQEVLRVSS